MRVILIYDIAVESTEDQNRLNKVRKVARKYIHQVQKSVFEGDLTEAKIEKLSIEIKAIIDSERDSVILYVINDPCKLERLFISNTPDPTDNII